MQLSESLDLAGWPSFLVDRSLGRRYVETLRADGWPLTTLADVWGKIESQKIEDTTWIRHAASNGFIALTKDENVRYLRAERIAIEESAARILCYSNGNLPTREYVERIKYHAKHVEALFKEPGPWLAKIYADRVQITWRPG